MDVSLAEEQLSESVTSGFVQDMGQKVDAIESCP